MSDFFLQINFNNVLKAKMLPSKSISSRLGVVKRE
jgi:hypothetical protein